MSSIESMAKETEKLIHEMDSDDARKYLMNLIRMFYLYYMNNNLTGMESCKDKIHKAMVLYDNDDELKHYLNYCIGLNSNIIIKSILKRNGELLKPLIVVVHLNSNHYIRECKKTLNTLKPLKMK